jgi:hypothetical protein
VSCPKKLEHANLPEQALCMQVWWHMYSKQEMLPGVK